MGQAAFSVANRVLVVFGIPIFDAILGERLQILFMGALIGIVGLPFRGQEEQRDRWRLHDIGQAVPVRVAALFRLTRNGLHGPSDGAVPLTRALGLRASAA